MHGTYNGLVSTDTDNWPWPDESSSAVAVEWVASLPTDVSPSAVVFRLHVRCLMLWPDNTSSVRFHSRSTHDKKSWHQHTDVPSTASQFTDKVHTRSHEQLFSCLQKVTLHTNGAREIYLHQSPTRSKGKVNSPGSPGHLATQLCVFHVRICWV